MSNFKLVDMKSGTVIQKGATAKTFRGEDVTVNGFTPPLHTSSTGRVHTSAGSFFPSVINAKIVAE